MGRMDTFVVSFSSVEVSLDYGKSVTCEETANLSLPPQCNWSRSPNLRESISRFRPPRAGSNRRSRQRRSNLRIENLNRITRRKRRKVPPYGIYVVCNYNSYPYCFLSFCMGNGTGEDWSCFYVYILFYESHPSESSNHPGLSSATLPGRCCCAELLSASG